jgi:hypothetical protein
MPGTAGFVAFDTLTGEPVDAAVAEVAERFSGRAGFVSARVHVSLDGLVVVTRSLWRDGADHRLAVEEFAAANSPDARTTATFRGTPVESILGPQVGEKPGVVAVATRYLRDRTSFDALMGLLAVSGEWKRHHRGFIAATPYLGVDGTTFLNYPMWTDEGAYRAWMADPRIAEGQDEIARLEAAPPSYLVCTVAADVIAA